MSKLEKLISELCPNGVEYKKLGEIGSFYGGLSGKTKNDFTNGNARFVTYMDVYLHPSINKISGTVKILENEHQNNVEHGDVFFTGSSETPEECAISSVLTENADDVIYLNSFCFGYRLNDKTKFDLNFLKHLFRSDYFRKQIPLAVDGVTRFNVSKKKFANLVMPIPPLEIQKEIANILDKFSLLEEELEEELEERRKQYGYYRNELLTFNDLKQNKVNISYKRLREISDMQRGTAITQKMVENGDIPVISGGREPAYYCSTANRTGETITIAGSGAGAGFVAFWNQPIFVADAFSIKGKDGVLTKYLYHYLQSIQDKIYSTQQAGGVPHVHISSIENFEIPIPAPDVQKRIVDILDNFEKICTSLNIGLPAEIEARQKQYEYYRDKLLQFTPVVDERERERESIASY